MGAAASRPIRSLKRLVRSAFHSLGFELHRLAPATDPSLQLASALEKLNVDLVLDVGANVGQFAKQLRSRGYDGRIVSFEPLSDAHSQLIEAARHDPRWFVHSRCALGARDGEITLNIAGNSVSSSALPMLAAHAAAAAGSAYVGSELVAITTLDRAATQYLADTHAPFLKVDTQGYEWEVLEGATATLPRIRGILCELSLVALYEGQHLWMDVVQRLGQQGFCVWAIQPGFTDPRDGRTLQADAVFIREP